MRRVLSVLLTLLITAPAWSDETNLHGHLKYQANYSDYQGADLNKHLGGDNSAAHAFDIRSNIEHKSEELEFIAHAQFQGLGSEDLDIYKQQKFPILFARQASFVSDSVSLFDLSKELSADNEFISNARLDRLSIGYSSEKTVLRVGRQALSWGSGLVYQVLDVFNPFAPSDVDKDYKNGADMLYAQYLLDSGSDLQLIGVPRRDPLSGDIEYAQSSLAAKLHGQISLLELDYDALAARHFNETMLGAGFSRNVLEAVLRTDFSLTRLQDGDEVFSFLVNIDRSWEAWGYNWYGFLEYFHNGFGQSDANFGNLSGELVARLERGELYSLGKNYIAPGFRIELTPLVNLYCNALWNLGDNSHLFQTRLVYDMTSNTRLMGGINLPLAERNTEFGGLRLPTAEESYLASARQAYLQLAYYY